MAKKVGAPGLMRVTVGGEGEVKRLIALALHKGTPTEASKDKSLVLGRVNVPDERDVHPSMRGLVWDYGIAKLGMDRASQFDGPEKLEKITQVYDDLCAGVWERESKRGTVIVAAWIEALAEVKGATIPEIQASLKGYTDAQKEKIRANPAVEAKTKEVLDRRAGAGSTVNLDSLLSDDEEDDGEE